MRPPMIALMSLILIAIVAALWTIGGPSQARAERRDMTRWQDLQTLARHMDCLLLDGKTISGASATCPGQPRAEDPFTGTAYVVEQVTDQHITLCAGFETDLRQLAPYFFDHNLDSERGCAVIRRQGRN